VVFSTAPRRSTGNRSNHSHRFIFFFEPFQAHSHKVFGQSICADRNPPVAHVSEYRHSVGFEPLCRDFSDSITWQRFCRIPLGVVFNPRVSTPNKVGKEPRRERITAARRRQAVRPACTCVVVRPRHPSFNVFPGVPHAFLRTHPVKAILASLDHSVYGEPFRIGTFGCTVREDPERQTPSKRGGCKMGVIDFASGEHLRGESNYRPLRGCRIVTTSLTARVLLANQLRSLSEIEWTVVSGNPFPNPIEGISVASIPMTRQLSWGDVFLFVRLFRYLKHNRFDIVQTHTPKASLVGLPAARLVRSAAIYSIHGARYFQEHSRVSNLFGWCFEKWCCAWASAVLVQSREDETVIAEAHICAARKVRYVGNGIMMSRFLSPVTPALVSSLPIVLMISRLVREKGVYDFIDLARRLSGQADFVHIGWFDLDRYDSLTKEEIASINTTGAVRFLGGVDDVRPYLASASVVVLPSYREGIPRVAMEGAAMGRPVACYNIRGVREVIDPRHGLLAPCGDVTALTRIVEDLIGDPVRCKRLGTLCHEDVLAKFSEEQVIERLRYVYSEFARTAT